MIKLLTPEMLCFITKAEPEFKRKVTGFYNIVKNYSKKYKTRFVPSNHVKSQMDIFVFVANYTGADFNMIKEFLISLGIITETIETTHHKKENNKYITINTDAKTTKNIIRDTPVHLKFFKKNLYVQFEYVDRTGQFNFTETDHKIILRHLQRLRSLTQIKNLDPRDFSDIIRRKTASILKILLQYNRNSSLHQYIRKRFKTKNTPWIQFMMSTFRKLNTDSKIASICHAITTLSNIFNSNDILRLGFDKDTTQIKHLITEIKQNIHNLIEVKH